MRSLWRIMASNWLKGDGSAALCGESSPLDFLGLGLRGIGRASFFLDLGSGVSHSAMLIAREGASSLFARRAFALAESGPLPLPLAV